MSFGAGQPVRYRVMVIEQGHCWDVLEQYEQLEQDGHAAPADIGSPKQIGIVRNDSKSCCDTHGVQSEFPIRLEKEAKSFFW